MTATKIRAAGDGAVTQRPSAVLHVSIVSAADDALFAIASPSEDECLTRNGGRRRVIAMAASFRHGAATIQGVMPFGSFTWHRLKPI